MPAPRTTPATTTNTTSSVGGRTVISLMRRSCRSRRAGGDGRRARRRRPRSMPVAENIDLRRCSAPPDRRTIAVMATAISTDSGGRPAHVAVRSGAVGRPRRRRRDADDRVRLPRRRRRRDRSAAGRGGAPSRGRRGRHPGVVVAAAMAAGGGPADGAVELPVLDGADRRPGRRLQRRRVAPGRAGRGGRGGVLAPDAGPARDRVRLRICRTSLRCCSRPRWRPRRWVGACSCGPAASCWHRCGNGRSGPRPSSTSAWLEPSRPSARASPVRCTTSSVTGCRCWACTPGRWSTGPTPRRPSWPRRPGPSANRPGWRCVTCARSSACSARRAPSRPHPSPRSPTCPRW